MHGAKWFPWVGPCSDINLLPYHSVRNQASSIAGKIPGVPWQFLMVHRGLTHTLVGRYPTGSGARTVVARPPSGRRGGRLAPASGTRRGRLAKGAGPSGGSEPRPPCAHLLFEPRFESPTRVARRARGKSRGAREGSSRRARGKSRGARQGSRVAASGVSKSRIVPAWLARNRPTGGAVFSH